LTHRVWSAVLARTLAHLTAATGPLKNNCADGRLAKAVGTDKAQFTAPASFWRWAADQGEFDGDDMGSFYPGSGRCEA
jgi:hypothetical protein